MTFNHFKSVRDSLYKVCTDFATTNSWNAQTYNFDAFSEQNKLPEGDLIGLRGLTMDVDTDLIDFKVMIGIATENDPNLFRLDEMGGLLLIRMAPEDQLTLYDASQPTLTPAGLMTIGAGVSLSPVFQAQQKALKFLSFRGFLDRSLSQ